MPNCQKFNCQISNCWNFNYQTSNCHNYNCSNTLQPSQPLIHTVMGRTRALRALFLSITLGKPSSGFSTSWKRYNVNLLLLFLSWPWEKKFVYIVMYMCTFFCFLFGFTGRKNWSYDNPPSIKNKLFLKGSWSLKSSDSLFYLCILHCTLHCITIWTI